MAGLGACENEKQREKFETAWESREGCGRKATKGETENLCCFFILGKMVAHIAQANIQEYGTNKSGEGGGGDVLGHKSTNDQRLGIGWDEMLGMQGCRGRRVVSKV